MAQYVTKIRTDAGDLPIDYNALANLPVDADTGLIAVDKGGTNCDVRNASVTIAHKNVDAASSSTCTYYPYLKMCFLRAYIKLSSELATGTTLDIMDITGYAPSSVTVLSTWCDNAMLAANVHKNSSNTNNAILSIRSQDALSSGSQIYISGWFIASNQ